jgi:glycosyltransferase involved in cell wall biosynthesis
MQALGGTEILHAELLTRLPREQLTGIHLLVNHLHTDALQADKINVLWNHHNTNQPAVQAYQNKALLEKIQHFVYVSHWQYEKYRYAFSIPTERSVVIKNATVSRELTAKPAKIKLIYTSTPWRGLDILLDAFELLQRDDVELDIYSSTSIYGSAFAAANETHFAPLFERAKRMRHVNYQGYASHEQVLDAVAQAHIFAYPCTWEETSCLSAIEAALAGLSLVTTNLGALYETVGPWAQMLPHQTNRALLTQQFARSLNQAIDEFWTDAVQAKLLAQHQYFKRFYTWEHRLPEWQSFFQQIQTHPS